MIPFWFLIRKAELEVWMVQPAPEGRQEVELPEAPPETWYESCCELRSLVLSPLTLGRWLW